jgi:hypothetical protein
MNQRGRKKQTTNQHQGYNQQPNVPPQPYDPANPVVRDLVNSERSSTMFTLQKCGVCVSRWEVFFNLNTLLVLYYDILVTFRDGKQKKYLHCCTGAIIPGLA